MSRESRERLHVGELCCEFSFLRGDAVIDGVELLLVACAEVFELRFVGGRLYRGERFYGAERLREAVFAGL